MYKLIAYEIDRMKFRGFCLPLAIILFSFYIFVMPHVIEFVFSLLNSRFSFINALLINLTLIQVASFGGFCLVLQVITVLKNPFLEQYHLVKQPPENFWKKAANVLGLNYLVLGPLLEYIYANYDLLSFSTEKYFPSYMEIFGQLFLCMIIDDFGLYFGHRLLHASGIYTYFHKLHHEYTDLAGYVSGYVHPVEFITNITAAGMGPMVLGKSMHMITALTWAFYKTSASTDQHSGYDFPWSPYSFLPFSGKFYIVSADFHYEHHQLIKGNYGQGFVYFDFLLNTALEKPSKTKKIS